MPELPEVEAICRALKPRITGRRILAVEVRRAQAVQPQKPADVARLAVGRTIRDIRRRGKNIMIDLSGGYTIRLHLRMTGDLELRDRGEPLPSDRIVFELAGRRRMVFSDSRALGVLHIHTTEDAERLMAHLGPEPLSEQFTFEELAARAGRSKQPIKLFLMDQTRVAGLGNIYAAEALFRARIHPAKPAHRLRRVRFQALHSAIVGILREAVESASTTYTRPGGFDGEPFAPAVYGREGELCLACGRRIRRIEQGGRSTYYCPGCQR